MAEGFGKKILSKNLYIESAGTEAHGLNPYTVKTMNEIGIDISHQKSKKTHQQPSNKNIKIILRIIKNHQ